MKQRANSLRLCLLGLTLFFVINIICASCFTPAFAEEFNKCGGVDTSIIQCDEGGDGGIWHIVNLVVDIMSIGVGILGVIGISVVDIQYLTAGPNTEKTTKAKRRLFEIVIGLVAYAIMFAFLQWLLPGGLLNNPAGDISSITINKAKASVDIGKSEKLTVQFEPADVTDKTLSWKSANSNIASVVNGVVVGKKTGKTKITATSANGKQATMEVTVKQPEQTKLDFSYKGNGAVKAGLFSSETMKIVENHLYDVNAENFYTYINSKGGFASYAKSLGGVFGKYYGKTITGRTEYDFQKAAEYVLGWMYMYGWDYLNGSGHHVKWGGDNYAPDAFYINGSLYRGSVNVTFDERIAGKDRLQMSTECGGPPMFMYGKLGIKFEENYFITRFKDLRPGDVVYLKDHKFTKSGRDDSWYYPKGHSGHNVIVGEVYSDRIVIYDGGSYFQIHKDFKRTLKIPATEEEEYQEIEREFPGFKGWAAVRAINFKR